MTNKEALDVLRRSIKCRGGDCPPVSCGECGYNVTDKEWNEAFTKALEVLEEQEDGACGSRACISGEKTHVKTIDDFMARYKALENIAIADITETITNLRESINKMLVAWPCDTCRFTYYEKAKEEGDE